ncbi:MAG: dockerin type I domain-containing protein [Candidatus Binatia bacterium]
MLRFMCTQASRTFVTFLLVAAGDASAHQDPPGCAITEPEMVISLFRGDGTTPVVGGVSECESIFVRVRIQKPLNSDQLCAFSGGTFTVTTPAGNVHTITSDLSCVGGTSGEGCIGSRDFTDTELIPYNVDKEDIGGGKIFVLAEYTGGVAHTSPSNVAGADNLEVKSTDVLLCSDGLFCTEDICNPNLAGEDGCLHQNNFCSDGNACTTDTCNESTDECLHSNVVCNDGLLCTIDACNPASGCVHTPKNCDDGNPCTGDGCSNANGQCLHKADGNAVCRVAAGACDAAEICTGTSTNCPADTFLSTATMCRVAAAECDIAEFCTGGSANCPTNSLHGAGTPCSSDGNPCTEDECPGVVASCFHFANSAPCDDGVFCNGSDTCSGATCSTHAGNPCPGVDGDGNCAESCDESADNCSESDPDTSPCSDGDPCTTADACAGGDCAGQADPSCSTTTTTLRQTLCGDANDDGEITVADALIALRTAVGAAVCVPQACDYNGDGNVSANDALAILRVAVGQEIPPACPLSAEATGTTLPITTTTLPDLH